MKADEAADEGATEGADESDNDEYKAVEVEEETIDKTYRKIKKKK